ncbi:hypothetical protein [Aquimonas voraii]|uniref:hypothetical protein n=1 Tax=Aquimonas voraii TaxID=265719 RepID=UPI00115FD73F|nr:hypothetical protein [Aquimonas voraii]
MLTLPLGASAAQPKPEFHPIALPPGKSIHDIKPHPEVRADQPVLLELRAHRHADGSLHFDCSHASAVDADAPAEDDSE